MTNRQLNSLCRVALLALLAVTSVAAGEEAAAVPMGYADARHLLARTGFGPTDAEIRLYAAMSRDEGVDHLLREARTRAATPPTAFASDTGALRLPPRNAPEEERKAYRREQVREGLELRAWWMQEMCLTPSPLTERMTLFWHNHFTSSQQKVRIARLMYTQNETLRANALGNFGTLLHAAAKDPAMLVYLDGARNRKGQPNENFAREVMELFTLGEGHYTEQDVKEAARSFTGWSLDREAGTYRFRPAIHDYGSKTVLGRSGDLDGDAVLDILLAQPSTAEYVTAKLWREFVAPEPDPREIKRIAQAFRSSGYDIKVALRALLGSEAFWAAGNRGALVKSPIEFVVGTIRQLEVTPVSGLPFAIVAAGMGQNLFAPPNVKGWPGGNAWIDTNTLLARKQFVDRLTRADEVAPRTPDGTMAPAARDSDDRAGMSANLPKQALAPQDFANDDKARTLRIARAVDNGMRNLHFDAGAWLAACAGDTPGKKEHAAQVLLLALPPQSPPLPGDDALAFLRATLQDPVYQLK